MPLAFFPVGIRSEKPLGIYSTKWYRPHIQLASSYGAPDDRSGTFVVPSTYLGFELSNWFTASRGDIDHGLQENPEAEEHKGEIHGGGVYLTNWPQCSLPVPAN